MQRQRLSAHSMARERDCGFLVARERKIPVSVDYLDPVVIDSLEEH